MRGARAHGRSHTPCAWHTAHAVSPCRYRHSTLRRRSRSPPVTPHRAATAPTSAAALPESWHPLGTPPFLPPYPHPDLSKRNTSAPHAPAEHATPRSHTHTHPPTCAPPADGQSPPRRPRCSCRRPPPCAGCSYPPAPPPPPQRHALAVPSSPASAVEEWVDEGAGGGSGGGEG